MCGYCSEANGILPYLHRQRTHPSPGPVPLPRFIDPLQETLDMPATLAQLKARHLRGTPQAISATLPTAFYRLWQTLFSGSHAFTLAHIQAHYAPADIQHFLATLAAHPAPAFAWLGHLPPHASPHAWQAAIAQPPNCPPRPKPPCTPTPAPGCNPPAPPPPQKTPETQIPSAMRKTQTTPPNTSNLSAIFPTSGFQPFTCCTTSPTTPF